MPTIHSINNLTKREKKESKKLKRSPVGNSLSSLGNFGRYIEPGHTVYGPIKVHRETFLYRHAHPHKKKTLLVL